jgi:hypothetical protein
LTGDSGTGGLFLLDGTGHETGETGHGQVEDAQKTGLVMDVFELIAQFLDVVDAGFQQVDLIDEPGGVEGLRFLERGE